MREISLALTLLVLSFILSLIWGGPFIRLLKALKILKIIRADGPEHHTTKKRNTPTMGGILIILPVVLLTILFNAASLFTANELFTDIIHAEDFILPMTPLLAFLLNGLLGAIDDWEGIRGPRRGLGMRARTKFLFQILISVIIAIILKYALFVPEVFWPEFDQPMNLGIWYIPLATFVMVYSANAINFTDGLDGLAGLVAISAFTAYGGIAFLQQQIFIGQFCFTMVGALLGFLWFNVHPAELFMGDTGSLALGATLGVVALMTGRWLLLPVIAIIPASEIVSVILQVGYFKITKGKRLFKMAPLHHHFEKIGWSETQVVQRFWLISLLFAILGTAFALV